MAENGNRNGSNAGNWQINANSAVSVGLVLAIFGSTAMAFYRAAEVVTDLGYLKVGMNKLDARTSELSSEVANLRRALEAQNRQQRSDVNR